MAAARRSPRGSIIQRANLRKQNSTRTVEVSDEGFGLERRLHAILQMRHVKKFFQATSTRASCRSRPSSSLADRIRNLGEESSVTDYTLRKMTRKLDTLDTVACVALSSDDKYLAAGSTKGVVLIYSTRDGEEKNKYTARRPDHHTAEDAVNTMRFVRDEPLLAIGTLGGLLHIYCFKEEEDSHGRETLDPVAALEGNGTVYGITCLATTDRIIAVGGKHERVHLFELYEEMSTDPNDPDHRSLTLSPLLSFHTGGANLVGIALGQNGDLLATATESRVVCLWNVSRARQESNEACSEDELYVQELPEVEFRCTSALCSVSLTQDGSRLVVGTLEHTELYKVSQVQVKARRSSIFGQVGDFIGDAAKKGAQAAKSSVETVETVANQAREAAGPAAAAFGLEKKRPSKGSRQNRLYSLSKSTKQLLARTSGSSSDSLGNEFSLDSQLSEVSNEMLGLNAAGRIVNARVQENPSHSCEPYLFLDKPSETGFAVTASLVNTVAIAGDHHITVFDAETGCTLMQKETVVRVKSTVVSSTGEFVVVGTFDKQLLLFHTRYGADQTELIGDEDCSEGSVVRSVCVSRDESLVAVGLDFRNRGLVQVFIADSGQQVRSWQRDKPVQCVRFSPNANLLAVTGYDCTITLYATESRQILHEHKCEPRQGLALAYLWSLSFSGDGSMLAYGCWNGEATVWKLPPELLDFTSSPRGPPGMATRSSSEWIVPDGEPPVSTSEVDSGASSSADAVRPNLSSITELAHVYREARVYGVALDYSGSALAVGGRDKSVALYEFNDAQRELKLKWEYHSNDFVYTVALSPDRSYCALGGTDKTCVLLSGYNGHVLFEIRSAGVIWSVALLQPRHYEEHAFKVPAHFSGSSGRLSRSESFSSHITAAHVAGNQRSAGSAIDFGHTYLAFGGDAPTIRVIDVFSREPVLELPTEDTTFSIAITPDTLAYANGRNAVTYGQGGDEYAWHDGPSWKVISGIVQRATHTAHEHVDLLRSLQQMIDRHPAVVNVRGVAHNKSLLHYTCETTNKTRILQMLFNANCRVGLHPSKVDGNTLISAALATGRSQSLHVVLRALVEGKLMVQNLDSTMVADLFITLAHTSPRAFLNLIVTMPLTAEPEVFCDGLYEAVTLPYMLIIGSEDRCPHGLWDEKLLALTLQQQVVYKQRQPQEELAGAPAGGPAGAPAGGPAGAPTASSSTNLPFSPRSGTQNLNTHNHTPNIQQGFRKTPLSAVRAFRVPFESIAGELRSQASNNQAVSPLQLICSAAAVTQNYAVFGSKTLNILLQFKWHGFAKMSFLIEFAFRVLQSVVFAVFNYLAGSLPEMHRPMVHINSTTGVVATETFDTTHVWFVIVGLVITTGWAFYDLRQELRQLIHGGYLRYFTSIYNWMDLLRIFTQLAINVLLILVEIDGPADLNWAPVEACRYSADCGLALTLYILQAVIMITVFLGLLYFFRANLKQAILVHILYSILIDISSFLVLLIVLWVGFACALAILFQYAVYSAPPGTVMFPEMRAWSPGSWIFLTLNMALYGHFDDGTLMIVQSSQPIQIVYMLYMLLIHIILLNLLIAIMQHSHTKAIFEAEKVAKYRRANLVLEQETGASREVSTAKFRERHPRWLHVLEPATAEDEGGDEADPEDVSAGPVTAEMVAKSMDKHNKLVRRYLGQQMDVGTVLDRAEQADSGVVKA